MKITALRIFFGAFILKTLLQVASASVSTEMEDRETEIPSSSVPSQPLQEKSIWGIGEEQLDELFSSSSNLIGLADDQFYHRINKTYIKIFGGDEQEILRQPHSNTIHPDDQQATQRMADQSTNNSLVCPSSVSLDPKDKFQIVLNFENRCRTQSVDYRNIQWFLLLQVAGLKTQVPLFLCIGQDITLKKQAAVQRQELKQAQLATQMKSTFVAHMSHELRTPLNGVIGFLDLALEEEMSDTLKYHLSHARQSAGLLLDIANNIVDVSRLEAGRLNLQQEIFRPIDSLKAVIDSLKEPADHKNITLKFSTSNAMPLLVQGDAHRFQQILFNLGSNAVKFTQHGKVSIKLDSHSVIDKPQQIMIRGRVKDTGIGINPQFIPKLFQPFSQEDQSMKRDVGGTGLGLYLTKELCEKMNGSIYVLSTPGLGSTFEFKVMMNSMDVDL